MTVLDWAIVVAFALYASAVGLRSRRLASRGLELPSSATESDCVRVVGSHSPPETAAYFEQLASAWLRTAYASREPSPAEADALCTRWAEHF